ncbi:MAG: hypothetical protein [Bacteriophage sp.]|nr:MAG: hypothetical protein [Bacteriophage sp.]
MTDTTDIKALRELLCHENKESDHHIGVTVTTLRLLLSKADALEAVLQRADKANRTCSDLLRTATDEAMRANKAEAELAALKGDQVPVVSELIPEGMKYSSALPEFVGDSNEISSYRCWIHGNTRKVATQEQAYADAKAACELFTAPQKPVVLPQAHKVRAGVTLTGDERNVMIPCDDGNWLSRLDVEHSIKMAGGIVKDGD